MSDLFAPPTPDELKEFSSDDLYAAPTAEELAAAQALAKENEAKARHAIFGEPRSGTEAAVAGLAQGLSLANSDELMAGAEAGKFSGPEYDEAHKRHLQRLSQIEAQHPYIYNATNLGGTLGTAVAAPGSNTIRGAMAVGAIEGAGRSEKSLEHDPTGLAADAALGAGVAGGAQYGFNKLAHTFSPERLREAATMRANKAATGEQMRDLRVQAKKAPRDEAGNIIPEGMRDKGEMVGGRLVRRGEDLLQRDEAGPAVVGAGDKWDDVFPKAVKKRDFFSEKLKQTIREADAAGVTVDGKKVAEKIMQMIEGIPEDSASRAKINAVLDVSSEFEQMGQIPFSKAQAHKGNYVYKPENAAPQAMGAQMTNGVNRAISDAMEEAMREAAGKTGNKNFADYGRYKSKFDSFNSIADASQEQTIRDLRRRYVSPSDYFAGGMGGAAIGVGTAAATGHLGNAMILGTVAAGGAGALNKIMRERGSATAARVAYRVYQAMDTLPTKYLSPLLDAAQKGGRQLELVDRLLMKNYPDYAATMMGAPAE